MTDTQNQDAPPRNGTGYRLTDSEVGQIRAHLRREWSKQAIADKFGVSWMTVHSIATGRSHAGEQR